MLTPILYLAPCTHQRCPRWHSSLFFLSCVLFHCMTHCRNKLFLVHCTLNGHFSCSQFSSIMYNTAASVSVFCGTYAFIFSYTVDKNIYTDGFHLFSKLFAASFFFPELFPVGPIVARKLLLSTQLLQELPFWPALSNEM